MASASSNKQLERPRRGRMTDAIKTLLRLDGCCKSKILPTKAADALEVFMDFAEEACTHFYVLAGDRHFTLAGKYIPKRELDNDFKIVKIENLKKDIHLLDDGVDLSYEKIFVSVLEPDDFPDTQRSLGIECRKHDGGRLLNEVNEFEQGQILRGHAEMADSFARRVVDSIKIFHPKVHDTMATMRAALRIVHAMSRSKQYEDGDNAHKRAIAALIERVLFIMRRFHPGLPGPAANPRQERAKSLDNPAVQGNSNAHENAEEQQPAEMRVTAHVEQKVKVEQDEEVPHPAEAEMQEQAAAQDGPDEEDALVEIDRSQFHVAVQGGQAIDVAAAGSEGSGGLGSMQQRFLVADEQLGGIAGTNKREQSPSPEERPPKLSKLATSTTKSRKEQGTGPQTKKDKENIFKWMMAGPSRRM